MVRGRDGEGEIMMDRGGEGVRWRGWEKERWWNEDVINVGTRNVGWWEGERGMKEGKGRDEVIGGGGEKGKERV